MGAVPMARLPSGAVCASLLATERRGKERRRVGGTLDAAPRSAWSGRVMIAKLVDPYAAATFGCGTAPMRAGAPNPNWSFHNSSRAGVGLLQ